MRILTFKGEYGYKEPETFSGLVCLVHFEEKDAIKIIKKASEKIIELAQTSQIILVPFAHLYESVADTEIARKLFIELGESLKKHHTKIILAPFRTTKELHLDVPADDSAIKFLNF